MSEAILAKILAVIIILILIRLLIARIDKIKEWGI